MKELTVWNGVGIKENADKMYSLTDMWKSEGSNQSQRPFQWIRLPETAKLQDILMKDPNRVKIPLLKSTVGRYGGTWASRELAIAYAEYLNPKFHLVVIKTFEQAVEETIDPIKGVERLTELAVKKYRKKGKEDAWIDLRLKGISNRHLVVRQIGRIKNVNKTTYSTITDDMNRLILGESASGIKRKKGLPHSSPTRDALSDTQLMCIAIGEKLAAQKLEGLEIECMSKGRVIGELYDVVEEFGKTIVSLRE